MACCVVSSSAEFGKSGTEKQDAHVEESGRKSVNRYQQRASDEPGVQDYALSAEDLIV